VALSAAETLGHFSINRVSVVWCGVKVVIVKDYTGHIKLPRSGGRTFVSV
jgi:hypothetical protein